MYAFCTLNGCNWMQGNFGQHILAAVTRSKNINRISSIVDKLINMNKTTYRQAAIDSSMPGKFKKGNETPNKFAWNFGLAH